MTKAEVIAALQLQQEWGIDAIVDDVCWNPLASFSQRLEKPLSAPEVPTQHTSPDVSEKDLLKAKDLNELIQKSERLKNITLARTAMNRLNPVYVQEAPFVLVGEVPDADEDRSGVLFSGQSGELLEKILASIGLRREELSMVPAIPWRPPGGRKVAARELDVCQPILHRSLTLAMPQRIVTMGITPVQLLLGEAVSFNQARGKWTEIFLPGLSGPVSLLPLFHPLKLVGGETTRRKFWQDLLVLAETLDDNIPVRHG
ncbi:uracil-DNA glycosylase [Saccharibacter sp. 17.LH.SD]|nr:uracil-DNA glycosylase [Saccharibacter sp. 17.LH.SD]